MNTSNYQVAYLPIGVPTFHMESAQEQFEKSINLLHSISKDVVCPEKLLLSVPEVEAFLSTLNPDLIIVQNITFANAAFISQALKMTNCPVLLWTLREPVIDGGRLRLNSLTGAYSASNALHAFGNQHFSYVFGSPEEQAVSDFVSSTIRAGAVKWKLKRTKLAAIGHTPQGFGFGRALDSELLTKFGVSIDSIEARELIDRAKSFTEGQCAEYLDKANASMVKLDSIPEANRMDFARLYKAYTDYIEENCIDALASRCWPDFFTAFGTPVCSVLSMLNDFGIAASCEGDIYGALSMLIGSQLTESPTFFGDPVSLDETDSTITFWHCGMAACSLARKDTGAVVGVHPNRRIGPVMDFGCRECEQVTVFRIGRTADAKFRLFILEGQALDKPKQFEGTSIVIKTKTSSLDIVQNSVKDGWEPHFVIAFGDIKQELKIFADMLDLEICSY